MFCFVHVLNAGGVGLPKAERPAAVHGYLVIGRHRLANPDMHAYLVERMPACRNDLNDPMLYLRFPQIVRVMGGILLGGQEQYEHRRFQPQRWWVVPSHPDPIHPTTPEALDVQSQHPLPHPAQDAKTSALG